MIERTGDINEAEKLLNAALSIPGAAEDMQRSFDAGIGASLRTHTRTDERKDKPESIGLNG